MPLNLQWVGEPDLERVARTRLLCYGATMKDFEPYLARMHNDRRGKGGDYLLAERDGLDVGTLTSLSLNLWLRGAKFPCQGIAWVGTIKSHRRGGSGGEKGIASQVMHEALRLARQRGEVISALMPFRATFYEHFGYGFAEKRAEWTIPAGVLPSGPFEGLRFMTDSDKPAMVELRQCIVEAGRCDIERSTGGWAHFWKHFADAMFIVDRPIDNGPVLGWIAFVAENVDGRSIVRIVDREGDSIDALKRQMHMLASLRDQHGTAIIHLPGDLPLNLLLRESQLPHRPVEHAAAFCKPYTRMQIRVLDHAKLIESICWPENVRGKLALAIGECEGDVSRFTIEVNNGQASVKPGGSDDVELSDVYWAQIVSGYISASELVRLGLIKSRNPEALSILDSLSTGPAPFCMEYF